MGASAESKLLNYIEFLNEGTTFIEVGSSSPPTPFGSTCYLGRLCRSHNFNFISIDINKTNQDSLVQIDPFLETSMVNDYAENYLSTYDVESQGKISCAYLDGYDWIYDLNNVDQDQVNSYKERGLELTNTNSQVSHLKQTMLIERYSDEHCIILYDDTWWCPQQHLYIGKGGASIYYLISKGWEVIEFDRIGLEVPHQAIMIGKNINPNEQV